MVEAILITVGVLLVLCAAITVYAYFTAFHISNKRKANPPELPTGEQYLQHRENTIRLVADMLAYPTERIEIRSADGVRLSARYFHVRDGAPVEIQFHGYRSNPVYDFCGGSELTRARGYNAILVDQRSHGESEGNVISFGLRERYDVKAWAEYAAERFGKDCPVVLTGVSMGAATVLMASALPLPENVVGIIADCPYSSPKAVIQKVCRDMHFPVSVTYPFLRLGARLLGGFSLTEEGAVDAVRESRVPILILHGEDDRFVPCEMSREIAKAAPDKVRLETFPGAGHALSYMVDPVRYRRVTAEFLQSCVNAQRS